MADIQLRYGPGATVAVLKNSLKALGLRAKVSVDIVHVGDELVDALELHLGEGVGVEGAERLPKTLSLCYRILEKRAVEMSAAVRGETLTLSLPPGQTTERYKEAIRDFCAAVADGHR